MDAVAVVAVDIAVLAGTAEEVAGAASAAFAGSDVAWDSFWMAWRD